MTAAWRRRCGCVAVAAHTKRTADKWRGAEAPSCMHGLCFAFLFHNLSTKDGGNLCALERAILLLGSVWILIVWI